MQDKKLGLIAGNGKFPILFAKEAKLKNYNVIVAGVKGDTSFFVRFFADKFQYFHVGDLGELFEFFKTNGVKKVIMAGQVNPDNLFAENVVLDKEFKDLFDAIKDRKADTIFSAVAEKLRQHGIELIDSTCLLENYMA
ncbi:MAG: hypothetical protein KC618_08335, partial [Candidatus Omnitrophica bacterium]|nr:hypothetical protein [Candidatus Omnitrophota bacterium]